MSTTAAWIVMLSMATSTVANIPTPKTCSGQPSGLWAYGYFSDSNDGGGYAVTQIDVGNACINSTLYTTSSYSLNDFAVFGCYPTNTGEAVYATRDSSENTFWTHYADGDVSQVADHVNSVKIAYSATMGRVVILYGGTSTSYAVGTISVGGTLGTVLFSFTIQSGYSLYNNIAAWDDVNQTWLTLAFNRDTGRSIFYFVNVKDQTVNSDQDLSANFHPVDLQYDSNTGSFYFLYVKGALITCNNNLPRPNPTNPRVTEASLGIVTAANGVQSVATIGFGQCLRLHAIGTWDAALKRYTFYAQQDYGATKGQYHNGIAYVTIDGSSTVYNATIGGYFGDGVTNALYGICPGTS